MTDRTYSRAFSEPGHRYTPRHSGQRIAVVVEEPHVSAYSTQEVPEVQRAVTVVVHHPNRLSNARLAHPRQHRSLVLRRKGLKAPLPVMSAPVVINEPLAPKRPRPRLHPANLHPVIIFSGSAIMAAVLVFGGGLLLFKSKGEAPDKYSLGSTPATLGATTTESNRTNMNEVPPSSAELTAYQVNSSEPRYLKIPKLQMMARVLAMDAGKDGLPSPPQNIFDTGWLTRSAAPGSKGVVLINGQVAGASKAGIFSPLASLSVGDVIQVERGDGKTIMYKVAKIEQLDAAGITAEAAMKPADATKPGLNLLGANSRYNIKTNTFEKRLLVRAVQQ